MVKDNNHKLFNESIEKFKYTVGYSINESPKYRPLVGMDEVFDELPSSSSEDELNKDKEMGQPQGQPNDQPQPPADQSPVNVPAPPVPEFDAQGQNNVQNNDPMNNPMGGEETVDMQQNDIIKSNFEMLKMINSKIETLENISNTIETTMSSLNAKVEEVKEPTDGEKLRMKKQVSYPFYLGISDLWEDNWFDEQREKKDENGIRELEDGTYVADFDDLPVYSDQEVKKSY